MKSWQLGRIAVLVKNGPSKSSSSQPRSPAHNDQALEPKRPEMAKAGLAGTNLDNGESSSASRLVNTKLDALVFSEKESMRRLDEYEIDFNDARDFVSKRWLDILATLKERLSVSGNGAVHKN